jgi:hypothetical protein
VLDHEMAVSNLGFQRLHAAILARSLAYCSFVLGQKSGASRSWPPDSTWPDRHLRLFMDAAALPAWVASRRKFSLGRDVDGALLRGLRAIASSAPGPRGASELRVGLISMVTRHIA